MRAPSERDQRQAKLDALVDGFMRDDLVAYRDAIAWLRNFADKKNLERGRVMCGSYWYTPREAEPADRRAAVIDPKQTSQNQSDPQETARPVQNGV